MSLADRADDVGTAWPSIPWICEWTCLGRTAVIDAMKALESIGMVAIAKAQGRSNRCMINLAAVANHCANQVANPSASRTGEDDESGDAGHADQSAARTGTSTADGRVGEGADASNQSASRTSPPGAPVRQTDPHQSAARTGVVRLPDGGSPPPGPDTSNTSKTPEETSIGAQASMLGMESDGSAGAKAGRRKRGSGFDASAIELPPWIDREVWEMWVRDRRSRKNPLTEDAVRLQFDRLNDFRSLGNDPNLVIRQSIERGWTSLQELKTPQGTRAPKPESSRHSGFEKLDYTEGL